MKRNRENCVYFRQEDGCKWCELGKTCSSNMVNVCSGYCKRLTDEEVTRVSNLQKVWDHLYRKREYELCDIISHEVGVIKETL